MLGGSLFQWLQGIWLHAFYARLLYPLLGHIQRRFMDIQFMNLGLEDDQQEEDGQENEDKSIVGIEARALRAHCRLYERTLAKCPLAENSILHGLDVLEVGCGLGGGLRWLGKAHPELSQLIGLDPHPPPPDALPQGIGIFGGQAQSMPFPANCFHILLNVESSHCYGSEGEAAFFKEAFRVLNPGGFLCWADIRFGKEELARTLELATAAGFELVSPIEQVNGQVLRGMRQTAARYEAMLAQCPWWLRLPFGHTLRRAFAVGESGHRKLANGEHIYAIGCWRKSG